LLPVYKYYVSVYTGEARAAGTDANVSIHIFGERGDTGKRRLLKALNNNNKFEEGQVSFISDYICSCRPHVCCYSFGQFFSMQ
jgi:hypothetical protein